MEKECKISDQKILSIYHKHLDNLCESRDIYDWSDAQKLPIDAMLLTVKEVLDKVSIGVENEIPK